MFKKNNAHAIDVKTQMSQINLFRALPPDLRRPSVTIPKDIFLNFQKH